MPVMQSFRPIITGFLLALCIAAPSLSFAAEIKTDPALRQLYLTQLQRKTPDPALETRITAERARVKREALAELKTIVDSTSDEAGDKNPQTIASSTALQKESALVDVLKARRQETKVDFDLLGEDVNAVDQTIAGAKGVALDGAVRRKADILARKASLGEYLSATDDVLAQEQDRLQRLVLQERYANFAGVLQVAVYVGILLLIVVAERFVRRRLIVRIRDRNRRYFAVKIFTGSVYVLVIGWLLYRLSGDYPGFVTSFAIVGAGIAVALQSIIKDVVGWIIIVQKHLFRIGQRVTIGPHTGDVADISLLRTTLVEVHNSANPDVARAGQTLYLPNALVLEGPVLNFHATSDFVEGEISVTVTYSSDWKQAEGILREILKEEVGRYVERARAQHHLRTAHFFASQEPPEPRVFTDIAADGILFTLRFQIPIGSKRSIISAISQKILERFAAASPKIDLAYKTVTVME